MSAMDTWRPFHDHVKQLGEGEERARFMDLLFRNFQAAGDPRSWAGFGEASGELQEFLITSHLQWAGLA